MSFGRPELFVEEYIENARHIEVQVITDGENRVHIFERDCSLQLRNQKVLEVAPPRNICDELRKELTSAALRLAEGAKYKNAGTVEFLVKGDLSDPKARYIFLEINPRIQVEHTISEEITGLDLITAQLKIGLGEKLPDIFAEQLGKRGIDTKPFKNDAQKMVYAGKEHMLKNEKIGCAFQLRINLLPGNCEKVWKVYKEPKNTRVDSGVRENGPIVPFYDSMVAKLIVTGEDFDKCNNKSIEKLKEFLIEGAPINKDQLNKIMHHDTFLQGECFTTFMEKDLNKKGAVKKGGSKKEKPKKEKKEPKYEKRTIIAPLPGQIVEIHKKEGESFVKGDTLCIISAMKLLNDVTAEFDGKVLKSGANLKKDANVNADETLFEVECDINSLENDDDDDASEAGDHGAHGGASDLGTGGSGVSSTELLIANPFAVLPDDVFEKMTKRRVASRSSAPLPTKVNVKSDVYKKRYDVNLQRAKTLQERLEVCYGGGGKKYVDRNRKRGKDLPRERIKKIVDKDTKFLELSALAAFGMYNNKTHSASVVCGIGIIHGRECMFVANDSTINGGALCGESLKKIDRAQRIAEMNHLPCIYLVDGGGANLNASLDDKAAKVPSVSFVMGGLCFKNQAVMSSKLIPQLGVAFGNCTAGAAYQCAMCDELVMVKQNGTIYLGGPPLVKAATGEDCKEQELGGAVMHTGKSGVADHIVDTEEEAFKRIRSMVENLGFQKRNLSGNAALTSAFTLDRLLPVEYPRYNPDEILGIVPEENNIPFEVREVIARMVDGSRFHEHKKNFGTTLVTGFAHLFGFPVGIIANNGMLFSEAAIKATHFIQICNQRSIPLI